MAHVLYFARNVKVYIQMDTDIWEIPVLDGFSFSQATNATEVTLSEAANASGVSRRGKKVFNDSYAPAEWSFSTYVRPFISAGGGGTGAADDAANHHAVEEALWAMIVGNASQAYTGTPSYAFAQGLISDTTDLNVAFTSSNSPTLRKCSIWFKLDDGGAGTSEDTWFEIENAVVNEATIDFDIEGIATIQWSGFGTIIDKTSALTVTAAITEGVSSTTNYIANRLTTCVVNGTNSGLNAAYNIVLTGGSITINNNVTFLTPENLGLVNQPFGHVTGARSISGNFTCYLGTQTGSPVNEPIDLFEDIIDDTTQITHDFDLTFNIGGATAPYLQLNLNHAHLEVPKIDVQNILMLDVAFTGLGTTIDAVDEIDLIYKGIAL